MSATNTPTLLPAAIYRPYAFNPSANPMGNKMDVDFGNPEFDSRVLQIDENYPRFIANYNAVRRSEFFEEYVADHDLNPEIRRAVCRFLIETLKSEYPALFRVDQQETGISVHNALLDETLRFDAGFDYKSGGRFEYRDGLDAIAAQIPEDLAIVQVHGEKDTLAAVHVVAPSGWAPREKLGGSFVEVHHPVEQHREWLTRVQAGVRNMAKSARPLQRFGWGLANDDALNHHPRHGGTSGDSRVHGDRNLYLRVERQILKGFPEHGALLFTIRVYVEPCSGLPPHARAALRDAVLAMSPEERAYKGVLGDFDGIIAQLRG